MMKAGEFKQKQARNRIRQKVFDACKRAREGEEDVWVTVSNGDQLVRVKLAPGDPKEEDCYSYACAAGFGAIFMMRGVPTFIQLEGKDGKVYLPDGPMDAGAFSTKVLGLVQSCEHVKPRETRK